MKKIVLALLLLTLSILLCSCGGREVLLTVFPDDDLSLVQEQALLSQILQIPEVLQAEHLSAEEVLTDFLDSHEDKSLFSDIYTEDLRGWYMVTVREKDVDSVVAQLKQIDGIDDVNEFKIPSAFQKIGAKIQQKIAG